MSSSTPTKAKSQQQNAVTPEVDGGNSSRRKRKQEGEEEVEPNHPVDDNGGSKSTTKASKPDDETAATVVPTSSTTSVNDDEINSIVTERLWSGNVHVVIEAMHDLRNLFSPMCNNFAENRKLALLRGAPIILVKAMRRHDDSCPVQGHGCALLAGIIPPTTTMTDDHHVEQAIIDVGGLAQCLVALDRYIDQPSLQAFGCKLIGTLWRQRFPSCAQKIVIQAGGPGAVIRAMVAHKRNVQVQQCGLYALGTLLDSEESSCWAYTEFLDATSTFIEVVIDAMERYQDDVYLQREGCKSLCAFAERHDNYRDKIMECKGLAVVFQARRVHNHHICVYMAAGDAIKAISGWE